MKVPQYKRQVTDSGAVSTVRRLAGNAGAGLSAVASGVTAAGKQFSDIGAEMQLNEDKASVIEATNQFRDWDREFRNNSETGIFSKKNKDAVGSYKASETAYNKVITDIEGKLTNANQKRAFGQWVSSAKNTSLDSISRFEAQQRKNWQTETAKLSMETEASNMIANYADQSEMKDSFGRVSETLRALTPGMGEEYYKQQMGSYKSNVHVGKIKAMLNNEETDMAENYLLKYGDQIKGEVKDDVTAMVRKASLITFVQDKSQAIFAKYGLNGKQQAMAAIRADYEGSKENALISMVKSVYAEEQGYVNDREERNRKYQAIRAKARVSERQDEVESIYKAFGEKGEREALASVRSQFKGEEQTKMLSLVKSRFSEEHRFAAEDEAEAKEIQKEQELIDRQEQAEALYKKYGKDGEALAIKEVQDVHSGTTQENLTAAVEALYVDGRRFKTQAEQKTFDGLYTEIEKAESYPATLKMIEASDLGPTKKASLKTLAKRTFNIDATGQPSSNPQVVKAVHDLVNSETLFKKYRTWNSFFSEYGHGLSDADQDKYHAMYTSFKKSNNPELEYSMNKAVLSYMKEADIEDPDQQARVYSSYNSYIVSAEKEKGRSLTTVEKTDILKDLLSEKVIKHRAILPNKTVFGWEIPVGYEREEGQGEYGEYVYKDPETGNVYNLKGQVIGHMEKRTVK